jgi:hypothetical protein
MPLALLGSGEGACTASTAACPESGAERRGEARDGANTAGEVGSRQGRDGAGAGTRRNRLRRGRRRRTLPHAGGTARSACRRSSTCGITARRVSLRDDGLSHRGYPGGNRCTRRRGSPPRRIRPESERRGDGPPIRDAARRARTAPRRARGGSGAAPASHERVRMASGLLHSPQRIHPCVTFPER